MITSFLDRYKKSIIMNKILTNRPHHNAITDPEKIKKLAANHFSSVKTSNSDKQKQKVNIWREEYRPKENINPTWYDPLLQPYTATKVEQTIKHMSNKSAPGKSYLSYK